MFRIWQPVFLCTPQASKSRRKELLKYLNFFLPRSFFSQEAKGRYCDWLSPRKRRSSLLEPCRSCQAQTWPATRSPSRTPHARQSAAVPSHLPSAALHRGQDPGTPGSGLAGPAPLRESHAHRPAQANRRPRGRDWQRPPAPPPASLWPAASREAGSAAVGRARARGPVASEGLVGSRTLAAGRTAQRRHGQPAPRRPAWTSRTVSGRTGGRAGRAGLRRGSVYRLKMAVCVALFCGPRARRWRARAGRFSAGSRTRVRGRPGVGGVPPRCPRSAPLRAPRPLGPILGLAQGRPQLPGLARRGRPEPAGAASGWRVETNLGTGGLPRATLLGGRRMSSVPSGWAPISPGDGICDGAV